MAPAERRLAENVAEKISSRKPQSIPNKKPTPIRILIIDDDDSDLLALTQCFSEMTEFSPEIHQASTLGEARTLISDHLFDIAIVAPKVDKESGPQIIRHLGGKASEIAFLYLSAATGRGEKQKALDAGALQIIGRDGLTADVLENAIHSGLYSQHTENRLNEVLFELERATRSRADFFAKIGHDLKTPLNGVIGYSDALVGEVFGPLGNPKYKEYAEAVREAGTHLLELIENLIRFSAGDTQKLVFSTCDLVELAAAAIRVTDPLCQKKQHTLTSNFADTPVTVACQPAAIRQAVINLLTNAIKYTETNGEIEISVRKTGRHAEIEIKDNGIGMSQADISIALQPFGRVQLPADKAQEGTGLGLHIVREIMARHRGQLDLSSAPGKGTTAILRLPLKREQKRAKKTG